MPNTYLIPEKQAIKDLIARNITGPVIMLNMLRFRETADYSHAPELAPASPISGPEAYKIYLRHGAPVSERYNLEIQFQGSADRFLIGPSEAKWDQILLVRYETVNDFLGFTSDKDYLSGVGHRTAALEDSRLLPITP